MKRHTRSSQAQRGFTLIEVVVALAIGGVIKLAVGSAVTVSRPLS